MAAPRDLADIDEDVIDIRIYSIDLENAHRRDFHWHVSTYNATNCTIQIVWDSPPWISSTAVRDILTFNILDQEKFFKPRRALQSEGGGGEYLATGEWELVLPP